MTCPWALQGGSEKEEWGRVSDPAVRKEKEKRKKRSLTECLKAASEQGQLF